MTEQPSAQANAADTVVLISVPEQRRDHQRARSWDDITAPGKGLAEPRGGGGAAGQREVGCAIRPEGLIRGAGGTSRWH